MTRINLDRVAEILRADYGLDNARVEETGGGVATLYAGPTTKDGAGDDRYAVIAGPGWFEGGCDCTLTGWADTSELYYGADDDGATAPNVAEIGGGLTEDRFADLLASWVRYNTTGAR